MSATLTFASRRRPAPLDPSAPTDGRLPRMRDSRAIAKN